MSFNSKNPREAAFIAVVNAEKEAGFISDSLENWRREFQPSSIDFQFARQLAYGTMQMKLALDYYATQLSEHKKLSLKPKERVLLRMALYQHFYLERIPLYALTDETIKLGKKYCHNTFVSFLNAILRKLAQNQLKLPLGNKALDLSIRHSFPLLFIELLEKDYSLDQISIILESGNKPTPTMVRLRSGTSATELGLKPLVEKPFPIAVVSENSQISALAASNQIYFQNVTPASLLGNLCIHSEVKPHQVLDLCASPGGKLIAIHDYFPQARLYGNDLSKEKVKRLAENCDKYQIDAILSTGPGETFENENRFDVIILDLPCSNSGVFNKRPEARWRITDDALKSLHTIQEQLISHAKTLLAPDGELWFMTCSILKSENEQLVEYLCKKLGLRLHWKEKILPTLDGWDGGFACIMK